MSCYCYYYYYFEPENADNTGYYYDWSVKLLLSLPLLPAIYKAASYSGYSLIHFVMRGNTLNNAHGCFLIFSYALLFAYFFFRYFCISFSIFLIG
jgi:hypothetical protein